MIMLLVGCSVVWCIAFFDVVKAFWLSLCWLAVVRGRQRSDVKAKSLALGELVVRVCPILWQAVQWCADTQ
jgi:hypothetical protein